MQQSFYDIRQEDKAWQTKMVDGKQYVNHRKDLLPTFLVSKKTKWNGKKPHTQIETSPKFRPAVHPPPSFVRFCKTRISSYLCNWCIRGGMGVHFQLSNYNFLQFNSCNWTPDEVQCFQSYHTPAIHPLLHASVQLNRPCATTCSVM